MNTIVVLAMHRTGSSLLSALLGGAMGIHMGHRFRGPDGTQPNGYYEDLDWRDINKALINSAGGTWYDPPDRRTVLQYSRQFSEKIIDTVTEKQRHAPWGFKDPRTCLTAHVLHGYLPNPKYIVINRNGIDVIRSLMKRAEARGYYEHAEHWEKLMAVYLGRIEQFRQEQPDQLFLDVYYELLTRQRTFKTEVDLISQFVGVKPDMEKAERIIRFR